MPFKQYKVLSYRQLPYNGFYDYGNTIHPYEITFKLKSWWGLRERQVTKKIGIVLGMDVKKWFENRKDKWVDKIFS